MNLRNKFRSSVFVIFFVTALFFSVHVFADVENQVQTGPGQTDLAAIRKHLVKIKEGLTQIRELQDKLEQEVDVVKIRIRRAGKGSS